VSGTDAGIWLNSVDAQRWLDALSAYRYPVERSRAVRFARRLHLTSPWFEFSLEEGTRKETMLFEDRFRSLAGESVEAWYEVIFWKLASTGRLGETRALRMIEDLREFGPAVDKMWNACAQFIGAGNRESFKELQRELFIVSGGIPVAATFPAFVCPERFPMADRWVARWVLRYLGAYRAQVSTAVLVEPSESFIAGRRTTLTVSADWRFYQTWIEWCRAAARVLQDLTGLGWRARDVEMAVFQNERSGSPLLPCIIANSGGLAPGAVPARR
jgi:hypothetical protein